MLAQRSLPVGRTWRPVLLLSALVVALAGCGGSSPDDGADPGVGSSDYLIGAAGYEDTRTALEAAGWACFDTIEDPAPVRRCYLDAAPGDPAGTVTFRFLDADFVGYVNVSLDGVDPAAVGAARDAVATAIGEGLLGGAGEDLLAAVRSGQAAEVAGVRFEARDAGHFEVIDPGYQEVPFETDILPPLAEPDAVVPLLEQRGLICAEDNARVTSCELEGGDLRITVGLVLGGREFEADEWSVSVGSGAVEVPGQQRMAELITLLTEVGIVGADGAEVLSGGLRPVGLNADIEGHHVLVQPNPDPTDAFGVVSVAVDRRLASEIES